MRISFRQQDNGRCAAVVSKHELAFEAASVQSVRQRLQHEHDVNVRGYDLLLPSHALDGRAAHERRVTRQHGDDLAAAHEHPITGRDKVPAEGGKIGAVGSHDGRSTAVDAYDAPGCSIVDGCGRDEPTDLVIPTELEQRRHSVQVTVTSVVKREFSVGLMDPGEQHAVIGALTRAFYDDPLFGFFFPNLVRQTRGLIAFMNSGVSDAKPFNEIWVARTEDGKIASAAAWLPPGGYPRGTRRETMTLLRSSPSFARTGRRIATGLRLLGE